MNRHRHTRRRPAPVLACRTSGCDSPRRHSGFCDRCWYQLPVARRLAIEEARDAGMFAELASFITAAVRWLARPATADELAVCGHCERAAADPVVGSCIRPHCPLRAREAA